MRRLLGVVLAASACGCSDPPEPVACAAYAVAGLSVEVTSAATGQPLCDALVTATEGAYSERLSEVSCRYLGAFERPGTYRVRAERDGFLPGEAAGVRVVMGGGQCPHVQEARVTVPLSQGP